MPDFIDVRGNTISSKKYVYLAHNIDDSSDTQYFGFVSEVGSWIIQRLVESTGVIRYAVGKQDYSTNWTNRASLDYDYINNKIIP